MPYDEVFHAKRLIAMLETENPCDRCPAKDAEIDRPPADWIKEAAGSDIGRFDKKPRGACAVCQSFVGILSGECPCNELGEEEAMKRTRLALEEKGYF